MSDSRQKLPEGWVVDLLEHFIRIGSGKFLKRSSIDSESGSYVVAGANGQIGFTSSFNTSGPVMILGRVGSTGALNIYHQDIWATDNTLVVKPIESDMFEFISYYLLSVDWEPLKTGTSQPLITQTAVKSMPFKLPPLPEQKRIVDVTGKLFVHVSNAKQRLDNVAETMKRFRKSVLNAACTGKLTEDWREQHPDVESPEDWPVKTVKEVTAKIQYGFTASSKHNTKGVRFIRITDIQDGKVDWGSVPSCDISKDKIPKYLLEKGDIVFARTGATTGKSFLITNCPKAVFASYLIRVKPDFNEIMPEFLYIFFQSDHYWTQISERLSGSAQPSCNATKLANLKFNKPALVEQQEIVRRVERLFELADKIDGRVTQARERVEKLMQSILAKTFRGDLVPTEAELARLEGRDYETAEQLLERIKTGKKISGKKDEAVKEAVQQINKVILDNQKAYKNALASTLNIQTLKAFELAVKPTLEAAKRAQEMIPKSALEEMKRTLEMININTSDAIKRAQEIVPKDYLKTMHQAEKIMAEKVNLINVSMPKSLLNALNVAKETVSRAMYTIDLMEKLTNFKELSDSALYYNRLRNLAIKELGIMELKSVLDIINGSPNGISPEELLDASGYTVDTIEEFYEELASLEKQGLIEDYRQNDRVSRLRVKN